MSTDMKYIDKYPRCVGCPVQQYCGTMVGCFRLCASYKEDKNTEDEQKRENND